jgi:hypothetical protein
MPFFHFFVEIFKIKICRSVTALENVLQFRIKLNSNNSNCNLNFHFKTKNRKQGIFNSPGACIIKLITVVIYGVRNKLVFVPKH